MKHFNRITVDAGQMGGTPCIRGLRIPVATVVCMISEGMPESEILKAYPDLELEDIREALRYAAEAVRERERPATMIGSPRYQPASSTTFHSGIDPSSVDMLAGRPKLGSGPAQKAGQRLALSF